MNSLSLNVGNFVTLKLTPSNNPLWREQVLGLAESQDLVHHLTTGSPVPPKFSPQNTETTNNQNLQTPNKENTSSTITKEFIAWQKSDRLLRGWIIGTLSEEALGLVIGLDTSLAVWNSLKEAYAQDSQEREFTLRLLICARMNKRVLVSIYAPSKVCAIISLLLANLFLKERKYFVFSQALAHNMKPSPQQS